MDIKALQALLDGPRDNAMLRLTLARQLMNIQQTDDAIEHLRYATAQQPGYSAAWKLLGQCLTVNDNIELAQQAYQQGIKAAQDSGDKQSEKEMMVFLRRLNKKTNTAN